MNATRFHATPPGRRRAAAWIPAAAAGLLALAGAGALAPASTAPTETVIKIERVKPEKEKRPTLRFLKSNRDFIRGQLDRVREKTTTRRGEAEAVDPRFLAYQEMLSGILASKDSVASASEARERRELLASVTDLGNLESELDQLELKLAEQRTRLARIQADFTGDQRTALAVLLSGDAAGAPLTKVVLKLEDGTPLEIPISDREREALRRGGAIQIFHGFVEPREQVVEVGLAGETWSSSGAGFVTLDPPRDRLTLLRLDLARARPEQGASSLEATTWLQDERIP